MIKINGFTLVELLVVIGVLGFLGGIILMVFTNSLRGSNKSQILSVIKQNGQSVLETMDKTIRNSDRVVCPYFSSPTSTSTFLNTLVTVNRGTYTRYRFIPPFNTDQNQGICPTSNGCIFQDNPILPSSPPSGANPNLYIRDFENTVCNTSLVSPQVITDANLQTGVSIYCIANDCSTNPSDSVFTRNRSFGYKDKVTIRFWVKPGEGAPPAISGQIDPVVFQTTLELR
ncbi:MAG: type II secretion system protein [Patescibacteria group bacterium]